MTTTTKQLEELVRPLNSAFDEVIEAEQDAPLFTVEYTAKHVAGPVVQIRAAFCPGVVLTVTMDAQSRWSFNGSSLGDALMSDEFMDAVSPEQCAAMEAIAAVYVQAFQWRNTASAPSDACPGCSCEPGDGVTAGCTHPDGCGFGR